MIQLIGVCVILFGLVVIAAWVWLTWFKTGTVGQSTVGQIITSVLQSGQLTGNLGYVELLRRVDAVETSPEALKACDAIADCLWAAAKASWQQAQLTTATTTTTPAATVKVTTTSGQVVEVGVATEEAPTA